MKLLTSFTVLVLLSLTAALESKNGADRVGSVRLYAAGLDEPKKVAIIGAGVAGSTTAYFLRQALSDHVDITVYEKLGHVGGRVTHIDIGGSRFELGGTVIHSSNAHMVNLTRDVGMHLSPAQTDGSVGIWDGSDFVFTWSSSVSIAKALWRYGWSPYSIRAIVMDAVDRLAQIYRLQMDDRTHFNSTVDLLEAVGVFNLTQETGYSYLERALIADLYVREFVDPTGTVHSIQEGNENVLARALDKSRAHVKLGTAVHQIQLVSNCNPDDGCAPEESKGRPRYEVRSDRGVDVFDAVVIAAPLEYAGLKVKGFSLPANAKNKRPYQVTHTTFVAGELNATYFKGSKPTTIATVEDAGIPFSSISEVGSTQDGRKVYKVFSRTKPTDALLDAWFKTRTETHYKEWHAYPVLTPVDRKLWPPFRLDEASGGYGVFYVNAMETSVSCMETEAIGAKNVALALCASLQQGPKCVKV